MHYEKIIVTPEMAGRWLSENNNRNRKIMPRKVSAYARDMLTDSWQDTHQNAIAFYKDGNLADGQHRLAAICESKKPLELQVWWGLDDSSAYGIDAHRMRGTEDQIKIAGTADWITKNIVATARIMMSRHKGGGTVMVSPQEIVSFCRPHRENLELIHLALPNRSASAPIRAAAVLALYHEDSDKVIDWCEIFASGIGAVPLSKTVLSLRERVIREPHLARSGPTREYLVRIAMRSIQAFCRGEVLTKIYEPKDRIYEI